MLIFFLIFFPQFISAKFNVTKTKIPPKLEAINESYVYVDYREAFKFDFSQIQFAHFIYHTSSSKASRRIPKITVGSKIIFQPLDESRKLIAKLNICEEYNNDKNDGPYIRLLGENMQEEYEDALIYHDPLKIIADEYRNKTCYQKHNQIIFWKENESDIVKICGPVVKKMPSDEGKKMTIEISLEGEKGALLNVTLEPCHKIRDVVGPQDSLSGEEKMYWIYVAVGVSVLSLIIIASVLVCRKKKEEKNVIDQNVMYGAEQYYEGSNLTDKNDYYD